MIDDKTIGQMIGIACREFTPLILTLAIVDRKDIALRMAPHIQGMAAIATELMGDPKLDQAFAAVRDAFEKMKTE